MNQNYASSSQRGEYTKGNFAVISRGKQENRLEDFGGITYGRILLNRGFQ